MMNFKPSHYLVLFVAGVFAAVSGYFTGVVLAEPPLDAKSEQDLVSQAVSNAVLEETGFHAEDLVPLGGAEPTFGSLQGDVLRSQPGVQHFLVNLQEKSQLKASLIESNEDSPHGNVDFMKLVEVDSEGNTKVLDVRI